MSAMSQNCGWGKKCVPWKKILRQLISFVGVKFHGDDKAAT